MENSRETILKLQNSDLEYKLKINPDKENNTIQINILNQQNQIDDNYYIELKLQELQAMNRYFYLFDSVERCANNLSNILKDSEPKLIKIKDEMELTFDIFLPGQEKERITILIKKKK